MRLKLIIICLFAYAASGYSQAKYSIRGQVIGRKTGTIYLYSSGSFRTGHQLVDSVRLTSPFFSFSQPLTEPGAYFLSMDGAVGQFYFVWDKDVVITLKPDDLNQSVLDESPLNETLRHFSDTVETVYSTQLSETRNAIALAREANKIDEVGQLYQQYTILSIKEWNAIDTYIRVNKAYWASLFILVSHHRNLGRKATLDLLSTLTPIIRFSQLATRLRNTVNDSSYLIIP